MNKKNSRNIIFSFFKAPISNIIPYKDITILQAYQIISGKYLIPQTQKLRTISQKEENRKYKASNFPYCTFSGTFEKRNEKGLIQHSGLISLDFDHVDNVAELRRELLIDRYFNTELLFISPNGNGLKWIISISDYLEVYSHNEMFASIFEYIHQTYSVDIDKSCKDVSRATFLCHDSKVYVHPKYKMNYEKV